jgi:hypothetical protein
LLYLKNFLQHTQQAQTKVFKINNFFVCQSRLALGLYAINMAKIEEIKIFTQINFVKYTRLDFVKNINSRSELAPFRAWPFFVMGFVVTLIEGNYIRH